MRPALLLSALCIFINTLAQQIPVEVFAGHKRSTLDIMFIKFFRKNQPDEGHIDKWLFFNRNRAGVDYRQTKTTNLPQFGFTEAISYNHPTLKGLAPVAVMQIFNTGIYPKAGFQYVLLRENLTFFSWSVIETLPGPVADLFILCRYTPKLKDKLRLFTQFEFVNALPTDGKKSFSFTQRIRLGLKSGRWQYGAGTDLNESGRDSYLTTTNYGGFIRYEF